MIWPIRKYDGEEWSDQKFRKFSKVRPMSINIWMIISYKGVAYIKFSDLNKSILLSLKYYEKACIKWSASYKNDSNFGGMFQHDQARAHMATANRELLE
jgi:hypothetical protein